MNFLRQHRRISPARPARDNHRMLVATAFVSSGSAVEE
jgi:hypothetical protein